MVDAHRTANYETYSSYKGWTAEAASIDPPMFRFLIASLNQGPRPTVLDFGFGDGSFLDWARSENIPVSGVEILPEAIHRARERGHSVYDALDSVPDKTFDAIVAIDVLEHLNDGQFVIFCAAAGRILKNNGAIVARFPNGASPFSGLWHYGDRTHNRALTAGSLDQVLKPLGWTVVRSFNPRPIPKGASRIRRAVVYKLRDLIETLIGYLYYGYRTPLDPNLVVLLSRTAMPL